MNEENFEKILEMIELKQYKKSRDYMPGSSPESNGSEERYYTRYIESFLPKGPDSCRFQENPLQEELTALKQKYEAVCLENDRLKKEKEDLESEKLQLVERMKIIEGEDQFFDSPENLIVCESCWKLGHATTKCIHRKTFIPQKDNQTHQNGLGTEK